MVDDHVNVEMRTHRAQLRRKPERQNERCGRGRASVDLQADDRLAAHRPGAVLLWKRPVRAEIWTAALARCEAHRLTQGERRHMEGGKASAALGQFPRPAGGHEGRVRWDVAQMLQVPPFLQEAPPVGQRRPPTRRHLSPDEPLIGIGDVLGPRRQARAAVAPAPRTGVDALGQGDAGTAERPDHVYRNGDVGYPADDLERLRGLECEAVAPRLAGDLVPVDAVGGRTLHQSGQVGRPAQARIRFGTGRMSHGVDDRVLA